ncbi:MAG: DUF3180 domain-containing protein [Actinomycetales bacterium]|nr:DUF3180 domain-containing protein [Actinomycetales bacterium]
MKPTRILTLALNAVGAAVVAFIVVRLMVGAGFAIPVSGVNLLLTMPAIGIIDLALVWPILRYKKALADYLMGVTKRRPKRPEPFYAVRVMLISKASAIAGAWFLGWHIGVVAVQLTTNEVTDAVWLESFGALGALLLVVAALVAERGCRLPDDGDDSVAAESTKPVGTNGAVNVAKVRKESGRA